MLFYGRKPTQCCFNMLCYIQSYSMFELTFIRAYLSGCKKKKNRLKVLFRQSYFKFNLKVFNDPFRRGASFMTLGLINSKPTRNSLKKCIAVRLDGLFIPMREI